MAWPPATYDVISRKRSNWFSLNLCQNVSKGYAYSYWNRRVLMKIFLGKSLENVIGVPLYARGLRLRHTDVTLFTPQSKFIEAEKERRPKFLLEKKQAKSLRCGLQSHLFMNSKVITSTSN